MRRGRQRSPPPILVGVEETLNDVFTVSPQLVPKNNNKNKKNKKKRNKSSGPDSPATSVSPEAISQAASTLVRLSADPRLFNSPACRELRIALHALPWNAPKSVTGAVSEALRNRQWREALEALSQLREPPPLGALQRWVRDCDAAGTLGTEVDVPLRVLDQVLRVTSPGLVSPVSPPGCTLVSEKGAVRWFAPFAAVPCHVGPESAGVSSRVPELSSQFRVVHSVAAALRDPPNTHPMILHTCDNGVFPVRATTPEQVTRVQRVQVPAVPGAYVLNSVLSSEECDQVMSCCETLGFIPDCPVTGLDSVLAENCNILLPEDAHDALWSRLRPHLPEDALGFNRRLRCYRYKAGNVYRPHIDGAWPGSGLDKDGGYLFDMFGDRYSKLTMLIYFNTVDVEAHGGCTTYFLPCAGRQGTLNAFPVAPIKGCVVFFPHGSAEGSLLHEGSQCLAVKYVARTEVLFPKV